MYKVSLDINKTSNSSTALSEASVIPARTEIVIPIDLGSCYFPVDERQKLIKEIEQKRRARDEAKEEEGARRATGAEKKIEVEPREFNPVLHARQEERRAKERALLSRGKVKHGEFSLGANLKKGVAISATTIGGGNHAPTTKGTLTDSSPSPTGLTSPSAAGTPRARREQAKLQQQQLAATSSLATEKNDLQKKGLHARQVRKAIATSIDALRNASEEDALAYKQYCSKIVADRARERNAERLKVKAERKRQMKLINPEGNYSSSSTSSDGDVDGDSPDQCLRRVRPPKIKKCHPSTEGATADRVHKARRRRQYELTQTVMDPLPSSCIARPTQAAVNLHDRQTVKERIRAMETELQNISSSSSLSEDDEDVLLNSGTRKSGRVGSCVKRPPSALGTSLNGGGGRRSINRLGQSTIIGDTYGCVSTHRSSVAAPPANLPSSQNRNNNTGSSKIPRAPSKRDQIRMKIKELKGSTTVAHRRRLREDGTVSPPLGSPRSRSPNNATSMTSTTTPTKSTTNAKVRAAPPPPSLATVVTTSVTTAHERHQQGLLSRDGDSVHLRRWMAMIFVANSMMSLTAPVIRQRLCFHNKIAKVPLSQSEVDTGVHLKFTRPISPNTYDCEMRKKAKEEARRERRANRREQRRLLLEKQLSSVGSMWMRTKSGYGGGLSQQGGPRSQSTSSSSDSSKGGSSDGSDLDDGSISFGDQHPSTAGTQQTMPPPAPVSGMNLGDIINATTAEGNDDTLANYTTTSSAPNASYDYGSDSNAKGLAHPSSTSLHPNKQQPLDMRSMVVVRGALAPLANTTFGCPVSVDFAHINNIPTQITTIHTTTTTSDRSQGAGGRSNNSGSPSLASQPHVASLSTTYGYEEVAVPKKVAVTGYHALLPYINFSNTFDVESERIRAAMTLDKCSLRISLYLRIFKKRSAVAYIARFLQERKLVLDLRDGATYYRRCVVSAQRAFRRRRAGVEVVMEHWKRMWREWEADLSQKIVEEPSDDDVAATLNSTSRPTTSHLSSSNAIMAPKQQVLRRRKPKRMTLHDALETPGLKPWFLEDLQAVSSYTYDFPTVCTIASTDGESVLSGKISEEQLTLLMKNLHVSVVHQRTVLRRRRAQYLRQLRSTTATTSDGDAQRQRDDAQRTDAAVNKQVPIRGVGRRDILGLLVYSVLNGGAQAAQDLTTSGGGSASEASSVLGGSTRPSREASRKGSPRRHNPRQASRPHSPRVATSASASARPSVFRRYSSVHEHPSSGAAGDERVGGRLSNASSATTSREPTLPTTFSSSAPSSSRIRRITVRAPTIPHVHQHQPATSREGRRGTSLSTPNNNTTTAARRSSVIFVTPPPA